MKFPLCTGLSVLCLTASPVIAHPVSVLIHPGGALVHEEASLTPDKNGILRLPLPPAADPDSLDLTVPGHQTLSLHFEDVPAPDSPLLAELRAHLAKTEKAVQEIKDAQADLDSQQAFWRQPPVQLSDSKSLEELDRLRVEKMRSLRGAGADLARKLTELESQATLLRQRLKQTGSAEITRQAVITLDSRAEPVNVRYSYHLEQAGWRPVYRLEALPDSGQVRLNLDAELWQRSGHDWLDVPLTLTTADPRQSMIPPSLSPWIIRPVEEESFKSRSSDTARSAKMEGMAAPASVGTVAAVNAPVYAEGTTFGSWTLGQHDLPAGPVLRLPLLAEVLKAEFSHILRPSQSEKAFLSALLDTTELPHLPAGEALFLVDGVSVGQTHFSLNHDENRLFFGRDPQVTAVLANKKQQSGKTGVIGRKQTYNWDWTISVFNKHQRPVHVRVEEPDPQSRDEQIEISVNSTPQPVRDESRLIDEHTLVWELEVPAKGTSQISHTVTFSAPAGMTVRKGR